MDGGHSIGIVLLAFPPVCMRPNTATRLEVLRWLAGRVRHVYWLSPEPQADWDTTDSLMRTYAPHCDQVFEVRNLRQPVACIDETTTN